MREFQPQVMESTSSLTSKDLGLPLQVCLVHVMDWFYVIFQSGYGFFFYTM